MKKILVSGASGIVGYGILKSLRNSGKNLKLIGTTIYEDSIATAFCDIFEKAIPTSDENYLIWLIGLIRKHEIDLIIPGIEDDLYKWTENIVAIEEAGAIVLTNNINLVMLCKDKWDFYNNIINIDSKYLIPTSIEKQYNRIIEEFGSPFLLKPKRGFASKGIVKIYNQEIFNKYQNNISDNLIVQKLVGNDEEEYTTSAFCDGQGSYFAKMTLKRKLSKDGFTDRAETVFFDEIDEAISHFCKILKPIGPTNFQFRKHDGELKLLEINPRISSSTSIRMSFGYNESEMVIDYFLENKLPAQPLIRSGKAIRYIEDKIIFNDSSDI